jgi:hypothetical protein
MQSQPLGGPPMSIQVWEQLISAPAKKALQSLQGTQYAALCSKPIVKLYLTQNIIPQP